MGLNLTEANAALDEISVIAANDKGAAKAAFDNLIQNLDVSAEGRVTVLYAGSVNDTYTGDIVRSKRRVCKF